MTKLSEPLIIEMKLIGVTRKYYTFELSEEIFDKIPRTAKSITIRFLNEGEINAIKK